ncbi:MAG: molybdopterin-binding protein [Paracoccaceae bacterium]|nr:molybdopterin-binding protein [Paracoccaceae bacterium]
MTQPTAAMLVIGDEILSGRTREANAHHLAGVMTGMGIQLTEIRVVADDWDTIIQAVNALRAQVDNLFTSGGIGPTHDDITADCVAAAFGAPIDVRADALAILQAHYTATGRTLNEARLRMARIPDGATLIENPVSHAPGFSLGNVHVMAGVPAIFQAMLESLRPRLTGGDLVLSYAFRVEAPEGDLAGPLGELAAAHPKVSMGSYPFYTTGPGATLILRASDRDALNAAADGLRAVLSEMGVPVAETPPGSQE